MIFALQTKSFVVRYVNMKHIENNILDQFQLNKGFLFVGDKHSAAEHYIIDKMLKNNEISRVKRGLYVHNYVHSYDERVLISQMYPKGVFCLSSAMVLYGLSNSLSGHHTIAMSRNTKISIPEYPIIKVYYWSDVTFLLGITEINIDDSMIKIYDLEKTVCDAIKHRGKIGEDITLEVIKNYIQSPHKDLHKLMQYAKTLRISQIAEQYIKPLL